MEYMALEIALQARDYDQDHIQHVNRRRMQATGMDLDDIWSQHTNLDKPDRYITSQVLHLQSTSSRITPEILIARNYKSSGKQPVLSPGRYRIGTYYM